MRGLLVFFLTIFTLSGYAQGIEFQSLSYKDALEKAKAEDKMIFVDCYTTWCGPCKFMAAEIFVKKEVGDYFNKNFISIKFDMESDFAKDFRDQFYVKTFPTFYYISKNGDVIGVSRGAVNDPQAWINVAKEKVSKVNSLETFKSAYLKGRKEASYKSYFEALKRNNYEEGMLDLFLDRFDQSQNKFDFMDQNKGLISNSLSKGNLGKFLQRVKKNKDYSDSMEYFFKDFVAN
ncbi:thioredoxin family protein [Pedobacter nyackensis]|uniref:thioredoxin family protein n=1 Tax=Pedobacter nyackensis TaxID=475255 RepID=UPI00292FE311|nr:DUF255 domain-containing protein [Pedobacter nyackensis]